MSAPTKILFIRFSSFGDINQCFFAAQALRDAYPEATVDWFTRSDFAPYLEEFQSLRKVHALEKSSGLLGLLKQARLLRKENYDLVYDAHNNLRSLVVKLLLGWPFRPNLVTRSKHRWKRLLLFRFRWNRFPKPFVGADSYLHPLKRWLPNVSQISLPQLKNPPAGNSEPYTLIAPAAAWPLKEWSLEKWTALLQSNRDRIVILGGPKDQWLDELRKLDPSRIVNLAGRLSWKESLYKVLHARKVIGVDTGVTHLADLLGRPTGFIIGPSAFGYPKRSSSRIFEIELWCKPCTKDGRGKCFNAQYKKCLEDISAQKVAEL